MKKFLSLCLITALSVALTACGGRSSVKNGQEEIKNLLSGEVTGAITVSCYETMTYKNFLEEAARAFEAKYPGTSVTINTFSAMPEIKTSESEGMKMSVITMGDDSQARADYINKINTEFMSGQGADILAADILPFYRYAENGQLEDLILYLELDPDFDQAAYRGNILQAIQYKGGQYVFPLDYSFNYLAYDSSLLAEAEQQPLREGSSFTYEQLLEIGREAAENSASSAKLFGLTAGGSRGGSMFNLLLNDNYKQFVDLENKKANFNDGAFAELLTTVQGYADQGYLDSAAVSAQEPAPELLARNKDERYFYKIKNAFSLLQHFNNLYDHSGMKLMFSSGGSAGNEEDDEIAGLAVNARGEVPFTYTQAYALNANSANKRTAWEFIKFLAGKEMQTSLQLSLAGFPVHNEARAEKLKMSVSGEFFSAENRGGELTENQEQVLEHYAAAVEQFSDLINTYLIKDTTITSIIDAETKYFFDGSRTAEEAAANLQNKVQLYLNE